MKCRHNWQCYGINTTDHNGATCEIKHFRACKKCGEVEELKESEKEYQIAKDEKILFLLILRGIWEYRSWAPPDELRHELKERINDLKLSLLKKASLQIKLEHLSDDELTNYGKEIWS